MDGKYWQQKTESGQKKINFEHFVMLSIYKYGAEWFTELRNLRV